MRYAERVIEGRITAGTWTVLGCERMIEDFSASHLLWDRDAAQRYYDFCADVCVVDDQVNGGLMPFELLDWQKWLGGNALGWKIRDGVPDPLERLPGSRRYRTMYLETGKGVGQVAVRFELHAVLPDRGRGIVARDLHLGEDRGPGPDPVPGAPQDDSREPRAESQVRPAGILEVFGGRKEGTVAYQANGGFIKTVAHHADGAGVSGPKPSFILVEEYHEHPTDAMREFLDDGKKGRKQPMTMIITNAGGAQVGPCWDEHVKAEQVLRGVFKADDYFPAIYAIDKEDKQNWIENRDCWPKANPSLGDVIRPDYILGQINKTKGSKSKLRRIERFNMTVWPDAGGDWLDWDQWIRVETPLLDDAVLEECDLYVTFDLADKKDLTAMGYNWIHRATGHLYQRVRYFTPADTLPDRARETNSYLEDWAEQRPGFHPDDPSKMFPKTDDPAEAFIETHPGSVLDYKVPARRLVEADKRWGVVAIGYDAYHWSQFCVGLDDIGAAWYNLHPDPDSRIKADRQWKQPGDEPGLAMVDHPQGHVRGRRGQKIGLHMPTSIDLWEDRILAEDPTVTIEANPVLRWNVTCCQIKKNPEGARSLTRGWPRSDTMAARSTA